MKDRKSYERKVVSQMIGIYCHDKHGTPKGSLCQECSELNEFAHMRIEKCRYGAQKTFCSNCSTHCYRPDMRERIRVVMRYSGPHMLLYHPIAAIHHLYLTKREKRSARQQQDALD